MKCVAVVGIGTQLGEEVLLESIPSLSHGVVGELATRVLVCGISEADIPDASVSISNTVFSVPAQTRFSAAQKLFECTLVYLTLPALT